MSLLVVETRVFSGIDNFDAGYVDKEHERIVGLQTDVPLKRMMNPYGGFRMLKASLEAYDYSIEPEMASQFQAYRKTHNDGVFDAYTQDMKAARSVGLLTGLPDACGRGRIIGDYRRVPLYVTDFLMKSKENDFQKLVELPALEDTLKIREEVSMQIRVLKEMTQMAAKYGYDIKKQARNAQEAVQFPTSPTWL